MTALHPAKFTPKIIEEIINAFGRHGLPETLLDPFGGTGRIHSIQSVTNTKTYAVEIEHEWAEESNKQGPTHHGDFFSFDPIIDRFLVLNSKGYRTVASPHLFECIATSPCYGNRMSDHHNANEVCRACKGTGSVAVEYGHDDFNDFNAETCNKCDGCGYNKYIRHTYTHYLGRPLTPGNSGVIPWGDKYKKFHRKAWKKCYKLLEPNGLMILNVKDHMKNKRVQQVSRWHRSCLTWTGFRLLEDLRVPVKGMGPGSNQPLAEGHKIAYEHLFVMQKV